MSRASSKAVPAEPGVIGGLGGGVLSSAFGLASVFWLSSACALLALGSAWRLRALEHRAGARG